jgi:hypothetical protein
VLLLLPFLLACASGRPVTAPITVESSQEVIVRCPRLVFVLTPNGPALSRWNRTRYFSTHHTGAAVPVGWSAELERHS